MSVSRIVSVDDRQIGKPAAAVAVHPGPPDAAITKRITADYAGNALESRDRRQPRAQGGAVDIEILARHDRHVLDGAEQQGRRIVCVCEVRGFRLSTPAVAVGGEQPA